jgi:dTDP-4-amino-4,6-dideoxygalactose transaminase
MADDYRGDTLADVSLFSFGPIKTATALGGGMLRFRDQDLAHRVRQHMRQWPRQHNREFLARVAKYCLLAMLSSRPVFHLWTSVLRWLRVDYDALISRSVRGFAGPGFLSRIRQQPCAALLALLERRLKTYSPQRIYERRKLARQAVDLLPFVTIPGRDNPSHTFWVFPILCDEPEELRQHLGTCGFDATRGASSMCVVPPPDDTYPPARHAEGDLPRLLYLPIYPGISPAEIERLGEALAGYTAVQATEQEMPAAQEVNLSGHEPGKAVA